MTTHTPIEANHVYVAERIDCAWPHILPGLQALQRLAPCDWDIEYIRELLDEEEAMLVLDLQDPTGFAVVELKPYKYEPRELELFVHLAYHQGGEAVERFMDKFDELAHEGGAKHVRFHSPRPGMFKLVQPHGYRWQSAEYVKEL